MHGGEVACGVLVAEVVDIGVKGGDCVVGGGEGVGEEGDAGDDDEAPGEQVHRPQVV
ncbi:TPA: hypothetical protein ACH3X2_006769 [Trebouxia sp. C0005]